jgi:acyl carrier protein
MNQHEKLQKLKADLDNFSTATPETQLESLPDWGSLTVLLIIVHFEENYGATVSGLQIRGCKTVGDLLALVP